MSIENYWLNAFWSLAPSVGIGLVFWFIIRAIIRADRNERAAYDRVEAEERAKYRVGTVEAVEQTASTASPGRLAHSDPGTPDTP